MGWAVPKLWPGQTIVVMGAGPSLTKAQVAKVIAADIRSIVVNRSWELHPEADWLHGGDAAFWEGYPKAYGFPRIKTTFATKAAHDGVQYVHSTGLETFSRDPATIHMDGNNGHAAIQLAGHAIGLQGKIILLGLDFRYGEVRTKTTSGRVVETKLAHWHGLHQRPCSNPDPKSFPKWLEAMGVLAKSVPSGLRVVNASPGSAIDVFESVDLDEALRAGS